MSRRAPAITGHLAGIALVSPGADALVDFYTNALGYRGGWRDSAWYGMAAGRYLRVEAGAEKQLCHAAFAIDDEADLAGLRTRLAEAGITFEDLPFDGLGPRAIRFVDPDGNAVVFGVLDSTYKAGGEPMQARLQHVVFASMDVSAMLRFYCDVVGFAPSDYVFDEHGDLTSAFIRSGEEHHSVAVFRAPERRLDHFCFDVKGWMEIRDWADHFAARHVPIRWGPGRHGPGNNLFLFINDPDGNWLEFSAELERVEGERPVKEWVHEERTLNSWGAALMRS